MSRPHSTVPATADKLVHEAEERVRQQESRLRSMIVQGAPTQAAEDLLRRLHATLREMKEHRRLLRGSQRLSSPSSGAFPEGLRGSRQPR